MAAKASEPTSWTMPSTVVSAFLYLYALYRMTAHRMTSMTELMIESICEVPGATSKLCGPVPKNMTATTTVTAIIMPEPMSPTASRARSSRARSPRASSMPSAGTSGNRVRKYSSVIPSLPHAKTLQLFNVIAQLRSSGGGFSVNWGVLGVRGKESVRFGAERRRSPYRGGRRTGHCARFINHFGGCSSRLTTVQKVGAARKMRPCGRTIPFAIPPF